MQPLKYPIMKTLSKSLIISKESIAQLTGDEMYKFIGGGAQEPGISDNCVTKPPTEPTTSIDPEQTLQCDTETGPCTVTETRETEGGLYETTC